MIARIDHIGIAVESIEGSRGFYELLGLTVGAIEEVPAEGVRVAFISCGESRIELLEATREDSPIARFLAQRGPGIHHLCLETTGLHEIEENLRGQGLRLLRDQPTRGSRGCWVQFVHPRSTGGVLIELSQEAPNDGSKVG
jgi:methylmalonyl-CoA/ethylmalonyl-CoA epimerase